MSKTVYVLLQNDAAGVGLRVDARAISRPVDRQLHFLAIALGVRPLNDFYTLPAEEFRQIAVARGWDAPPYEEDWYSAAEGLMTVRALLTHLRSHPDAVEQGESVMHDLEQVARMLEEASKHNVAWHLGLTEE